MATVQSRIGPDYLEPQQLSGKKYCQGHPASNSFQTRQKRLKSISLCFRSLFHSFGAALKTIYLCRCLRGTLAISKVLRGSFVSSESFSYPDGSFRNCGDTEWPYFHQKILGEVFSTNNCQILGINGEKSTSNNGRDVNRKTLNGYPEIFSLS